MFKNTYIEDLFLFRKKFMNVFYSLCTSGNATDFMFWMYSHNMEKEY